MGVKGLVPEGLAVNFQRGLEKVMRFGGGRRCLYNGLLCIGVKGFAVKRKFIFFLTYPYCIIYVLST